MPINLRESVLLMLERRQPINDAERVSIERTVAELGRLSDPFDPEAGLIHVTGSGIVIGERGVILLRHKRLGLWLQPGGHLEVGETPWDAAARETREETGLAVQFAALDRSGIPDLVHVDVHPGGRQHTHLDLRFLLLAGADDPDPPAGESQDVYWFEWPAAIERASDGRLRALLEHLAANRDEYPLGGQAAPP